MSEHEYDCPKCGEKLIKSESNLSKNGYMIPMNLYDGKLSRHGENHKCPAMWKSEEPKIVNEKSHDLHEYLRHKLVLNGEYWYKYHDNKYAGIHSRATPEELKSWEPEVK